MEVLDTFSKPHAVVVPFPSQSHIKGMMKVAKLLHHKGFHITFVNTEFNQNRLIKSRGVDSLKSLPRFQFRTIPDGLPPSDPDATQDVPSLCRSVRKNFLTPFRSLLAELNDASGSGGSFPPVTCIVADGVTPFAVLAGKELGIPVVLFWTFSASGFMGFYQFDALLKRGFVPLKDESYISNGYLDTVIDWIPGMKDIRLKNLPSFLRTTDPKEEMFRLLMEAPQEALEATALGLHTFDTLEKDLVDALSSIFPNVLTIGPLQSLLNNLSEEEQLESLGYSLWKEDPECIEWLDSKKPGSVVYINFGSVTVMSKEHLVEFAMGIANSNNYFLWIIRRDVVIGDSAVLPPEFEELTKERGMIAEWCPQEEVLNHSSIGGFLTHSGWNSTIESLSSGIPMICWPFFADQQTNCWSVCNAWEVGVEISSDVKRNEVEDLVRELMEGEKGKKMKNKAKEWKKLAKDAADPKGSSSMNLDKLVNILLSKN